MRAILSGLPQSTRQVVVQVLQAIRRRMLMLIVRVPALTAFYYLLRGTYAFEQQGVLAGRLGYLKAQ